MLDDVPERDDIEGSRWVVHFFEGRTVNLDAGQALLGGFDSPNRRLNTTHCPTEGLCLSEEQTGGAAYVEEPASGGGEAMNII